MRSALLLLVVLAGCDRQAATEPPLVLDGTLPPRPAVASCHLEGQPPGVLPEIELVAVDVSVSLAQPVAMAPAPDASGDVLVLERSGRIWRLSDPDGGALAGEIVYQPPATVEAMALDTSPQHPDRLFVVLRTTGGIVRLSRLTLGDPVIDPASERVVLASARSDRAALAFAPDGLLFAAFADSSLDPDESLDAQNPETLEGGVVRIDVTPLDATGGYAVPPEIPISTRTVSRAPHGARACDCPALAAGGWAPRGAPISASR